MKWILVWWLINPGHPQVMHIERGFQNQVSCLQRGATLDAAGQQLRWHCSIE